MVDGLGVGDAVFDDGRGNQNVELAIVEALHHFFHHLFVHLAMDDAAFGVQTVGFDLRSDGIDGIDFVVDVENLAMAGDLALDEFADQRELEWGDVSLNRHPRGRRRIDLA